MHPWRFPVGSVKFVVAELKWLLFKPRLVKMPYFSAFYSKGDGMLSISEMPWPLHAAPLSHKQSFHHKEKACRWDGVPHIYAACWWWSWDRSLNPVTPTPSPEFL